MGKIAAPPYGDTPRLKPWLPRLVFPAVVVALLFIELFITFRGLSSSSGMDQAQIARELARGNGFSTQVVRPYAWRQMLRHDAQKNVVGMSDTAQPPLPSLVLAPCFKLLEDDWVCTPETRIYILDRVVAGVSLMFFIAAMGLTWLMVERLFDSRIAGWTVLMMTGCQLLWDVARSGLAPMMVLFFFSLALLWMTQALENKEAGRNGGLRLALGMGLAGAMMVFSHWLAAWLVLGLAVSAAVFLKPRLGVVLLLPALVALAAWGWRNQGVCGDVMGVTKATLQSILMSHESWLLRDFTAANPPVDLPFLLRKMLSNFLLQLRQLPVHLGVALPALLFFPALLHPFKRTETSAMRWTVAICWLAAVTGMCLVGLPGEEKDPNQLHTAFIPMFGAYGLALLIILWSRLDVGQGQGWWSRNVALVIVLALSVLPMVAALSAEIVHGLRNKGQFAHWPPYLPDRFARLQDFTTKDEILASDVPWAIAWYADRPCIWLPREQGQFTEMLDLMKQRQQSFAGFVFTPYSAQVGQLAEVFSGQYHAWAPHIYRGMGVGFGVDTLSEIPSDYKEFFPLAGQPVPGGHFIAEMVFMSDKKRWETPPASR